MAVKSPLKRRVADNTGCSLEQWISLHASVLCSTYVANLVIYVSLKYYFF